MNEITQYLMKILDYKPTQCIIQARPYPSITKKYIQNISEDLNKLKTQTERIAQIHKVLDMIEKGEISI